MFCEKTGPVDKPLVSVVIPVYEAEKYLRQCVDSVLAQSYDCLEIILVDDGSTDGSGALCDWYAARNGNVRVVHRLNGGLSEARNTGIDTASGDYITFIDADDFVDPRYVESMVDAAVAENAEVACVGFVEYSEGQEIRYVAGNPAVSVLCGKEYIRKVLFQTFGNNSSCGKLFRKDLLEKERFTPGTGYEDLDIFPRLFLGVRKVVTLEGDMYYYRNNPASYIHTFTPRRVDVLDVADRMVEWISARCPELADAARSRRLSACFNIFSLMAANRYDDKATERRCRNVILSDRGHFLFHPEVRMKNRAGIILSYIGGMRLLRILARITYR